jgi:hypothetical protein
MRLRGLLIVIMIAIVSTIPASAKMQPRFWVGGQLGFNSYSMGDMNDYIDYFNNYYSVAMNKITSGFSYGVEAGVQLNSSLGIYAGYDNMSATTKLTDLGGQLTFDFPVEEIYGGIQYAVWRLPNWDFGFAGDIGSASISGKETHFADQWGAVTYSVTGNDIFYRIRLFSDYKAGKVFIISPSIGYRIGKFDEFKEDGVIVYKPDESKMAMDYSGMIVRLTIKANLNPGK